MEHDFRINCIDDERAYHNTAILIFLKAVKETLGETGMVIGNSLNQGYFAYPEKKGLLTSIEIHKIWNKMDSIISKDIEIIPEKYTNAEAISLWEKSNYREKAGLLQDRDPDEEIEISNIDGYRNCMYSRILPSTGYIKLFELRPYRRGVLLRLPNALNPESIPVYRDDDKLYDAYADSVRRRRNTGIIYLADVNRKIEEDLAEGIILASEWLQNKQIEEFAESIVKGNKRVVLIAGPSSSGKTTTAKRLCGAIAERATEPLYMGTDDYFVERSETPVGPDGKPDFEGLEALDLDLFNHDMESLLAGNETDLPEFDFVSGTKKFGHRITKLEEGQILVIEGIHSLNDVLTRHIPHEWKYKIYISPLTMIGVDRHNRISTSDARLLRRIVRDNKYRGYNAEATLAIWPKVRAGESVNIFPYSSSADVVFNSSTVYETNLLRTYAEPLLSEIPKSSEMYTEAQRILNFMKYFRRIDSSEAVPDNAILREFIGKRE